ncbi:GGDEF domain-containing protein [Vogesella alkaliphila]|uniref:diguanylate cyclase n=1 Tax=Vogesella alkaliphila TaxID=1193621 RepID=A0ABQ2YLV3_9NEIS|nr:GGDEF domain-containing protein [Vogesella alkaliphila]GGX85625.1 hypothetical protein GCM10011290_11660 [Vogesella alkaliphila]
MAPLDTPTLLTAIALVYGIGGVMVYAGRDRLTGRGIEAFWLGGSLLMAALMLYLAFPPAILPAGDIGTWLLPTALLTGLKNELLGQAVARLTEGRRAWWHGARASVAQAALLLGGVVLLPQAASRQALFLLVSAWFFAGIAHQLLHKHHKRGPAALLLGGASALFGLYLLAYAASASQPAAPSLLSCPTLLLLTLLSAVMLQLGFIQVQRELQYRQLSKLAALDPLTGIFNRRTFFDLALRQYALHARQQRSLALLMIDLDHFKRINDTYGHRKGDQALRAVADHIADEVRQGDIFARIGGEEFCLLLPDTDAAGARQVADKLCRALNRILLDPADPATQLTASIGVASGTPQPGASWNQLFDSADRRLYLAKSGGRNRVVDRDSPVPN